MSWDVMVFSSKQQIASIEEIEEEQLIAIDFDAALKAHFSHIAAEGDYRVIQGAGYSISYFAGEAPEANLLFQLDGEQALFELILVSKKQGWQIFDTGNGEMINLDQPEHNGYEAFREYRRHIIRAKG